MSLVCNSALKLKTIQKKGEIQRSLFPACQALHLYIIYVVYSHNLSLLSLFYSVLTKVGL